MEVRQIRDNGVHPQDVFRVHEGSYESVNDSSSRESFLL